MGIMRNANGARCCIRNDRDLRSAKNSRRPRYGSGARTRRPKHGRAAGSRASPERMTSETSRGAWAIRAGGGGLPSW